MKASSASRAVAVAVEETGMQSALSANLDEGYAILERRERAWIADGRVPSGWKVGLTSPAAQQRFDADGPCFGRLFSDMASPAGSTIESGRFESPRIEAEIAFRLRRDLRPGESILEAVAEVMPAIEIVDSRYPNGPPHLGALIADNVSGAGFVLGRPTPFTTDFDLAACRASVFRNGEIECEGIGSQSLGDPLHALAWLVGELGRRQRTLKGGEVVLSGSLNTPFAALPGDEVAVTLESLGSVSISFSGDP